MASTRVVEHELEERSGPARVRFSIDDQTVTLTTPSPKPRSPSILKKSLESREVQSATSSAHIKFEQREAFIRKYSAHGLQVLKINSKGEVSRRYLWVSHSGASLCVGITELKIGIKRFPLADLHEIILGPYSKNFFAAVSGEHWKTRKPWTCLALLFHNSEKTLEFDMASSEEHVIELVLGLQDLGCISDRSKLWSKPKLLWRRVFLRTQDLSFQLGMAVPVIWKELVASARADLKEKELKEDELRARC